MRPHGLIDTGAIVALLDASDPWHDACAAALRETRLPLATTAAVIGEVFHFVSESQIGGGVAVTPQRHDYTRADLDRDLPDLERLMLKYADRPMDFADATLVRLAEREGLTTILTVDRDFEVYRIGGRKAFRVLPKR